MFWKNRLGGIFILYFRVLPPSMTPLNAAYLIVFTWIDTAFRQDECMGRASGYTKGHINMRAWVGWVLHGAFVCFVFEFIHFLHQFRERAVKICGIYMALDTLLKENQLYYFYPWNGCVCVCVYEWNGWISMIPRCWQSSKVEHWSPVLSNLITHITLFYKT